MITHDELTKAKYEFQHLRDQGYFIWVKQTAAEYTLFAEPDDAGSPKQATLCIHYSEGGSAPNRGNSQLLLELNKDSKLSKVEDSCKKHVSFLKTVL